jgi:predicted Zn-dependent peptidase
VRALLILLLLLRACPASTPEPASAQDTYAFTLANGLRVIVAVRPKLQMAAVNLSVDLGSLDDPIGQSGIAHMLEHTTLSGAANVGSLDPQAEGIALAELDRANRALDEEKSKSDTDSAVLADLERWFAQAQRAAQATAEDREVIGSRLEANGAIGLNATTSTDVTQFFTSIPAANVDLWLSLEAARLRRPIFRRYYLERNVVLREIEGLTGGRPTCQELLLRDIFPASPLAQSLAGDPKALKKIDRPAALDYFHRFYRPERTVIVVVGNLQPEAIRAACEKYFGDWRPEPPAQIPRSRASHISPLKELRTRSCNSVRNPLVLMAFPQDAPTTTQLAAVDVLAELINSEDLSPLSRRLVERQTIAWNIEASSNFPSYKIPGFFLVHVYGVSGVEHQRLIEEARKSLQDLSSLPDEDIRGGIFAAEMKIASQFDDPPSFASLLGANEAVQGNWKASFERLAALRSLSAQDVRKAAKSMFGSRPSSSEAVSEK